MELLKTVWMSFPPLKPVEREFEFKGMCALQLSSCYIMMGEEKLARELWEKIPAIASKVDCYCSVWSFRNHVMTKSQWRKQVHNCSLNLTWQKGVWNEEKPTFWVLNYCIWEEILHTCNKEISSPWFNVLMSSGKEPNQKMMETTKVPTTFWRVQHSLD